MERIIHQLVDARLLVVQGSSHGEGATVEIIHEALIHGWPSLAHWLDENQEDAVFLEQLRTAARQWEARGRSTDLLWRGETMQEAQNWYRRYRGTLPPLQEQYLHAVFAWADRATRIKRALVAGTMVFLSLLVLAGGVALVAIRNAERQAREQAAAARAAERSIRERVEHEWHAPLDQLLAGAELLDLDLESLESEAGRVVAALEAIGPVNPLAVEEHAEEAKRFEFLAAQRDDLVAARQSLLQAIREIDGTARTMFVETFEAIRGHFAHVFATLFGGGECELRQ